MPFLYAQKAVKKSAVTHAKDSATEARKIYADSIKHARLAKTDSVKKTTKSYLDSIKTVRKVHTDSVKNVRKNITDSLAAIKKYKASKGYKDSVAKAGKNKTAAAHARGINPDSLKAARKRVLDSSIAVRKKSLDSVKRIVKRRTDSLGRIRAYRQSKRFKDSVTIIREDLLDSAKEVRQHRTDSMVAARKQLKATLTKARKHVMDSTTAARNKLIEALKAKRKVRADSIAKIKAQKEKLLKSQQNLRTQKAQFALDLKLKQKREKWSNEQMLKKKWSVQRQVVQNTFTRYNYFYNAKRKMDEALVNMNRAQKENYDTLIGLYAYDPNRDSTLMSADMDSIIRKVSIGIQIHDPRTKWEDDMYLLLGQAYYYKGSYTNAGIAFRYMIAIDERNKKPTHGKNSKEPSIVENDKKSLLDFLKHKAVHNEAILWLARTFTESHQLENASAILSLLDADPNLPDNLKGRLALEKAFVSLSDNNYKDAALQLDIATKDNNLPSYMRQRSAFLNGQLLQRDHNYAASAESFKKVLDFNPKIEMEFYARKYMAYNTMYAGGDVKGVMSSMKQLLNDGKYINYYEQIYYILGNLYAGTGNSKDAIASLQKGLKTPKSTKAQKAITFATLGNVYYSTHAYIEAKTAYDSATRYGGNSKDTLIAIAVKRNKALSEIVGPVGIIHNLDSLLELAALSESEQKAAIKAYLRRLENQRTDSIFKAQTAGINSVAQSEQGSDNGWYFSNASQMQQGNNEFKRKWGNRPLADNWRRSASLGIINTNIAGTQGAEDEPQDNSVDENGLPTKESLLAAIPRTPEKQEKARKTIQKAYIDLANAYLRELEDYTQTIRALDTLDKLYPKHEHKAEGTYLRYLVALRRGQLDDAKIYAAQLQELYGSSQYATLVRPKEDGSNLPHDIGLPVSVFYDETYQLLVNHQYSNALIRVAEANRKYKDSVFTKKFKIIEAIALAGSGQYKLADTMLSQFNKSNPGDTLTYWANAVITLMKKYPGGMPPGDPNAPPSTWPYIKEKDRIAGILSSDTVYSQNYKQPEANANNNNNRQQSFTEPTSSLPGMINYVYKPEEENYFVITFPGIDTRMVKIRKAVTQLDSANYSDKNLAVLVDLFTPDQGAMIVKKFANAAEAKGYMAAIMAKTDLFKDYKNTDYNAFVISPENYQKLLFDRDILVYLSFYYANYK